MMPLLFDRGAESVGLDFLAHPFWDRYIEYEERQDAPDRVFGLLKRIISIPMHQYARYYERFRTLAVSKPIETLVDEATVTKFRTEVQGEAASLGATKTEADIERDVRAKVDAHFYQNFLATQTETTRRWAFEGEIKRPYFHVTELENSQLNNWRKYLDFEESDGDAKRIAFLYERCLVTCAFYDEMWFRYARWMSGQPGREEDMRTIFLRATTLFVPISRPGIRLQFAYFEEMCGRVDMAREIHEAILINLPNCAEAVVSLANLQRRQAGVDAALEFFKARAAEPEGEGPDEFARAVIVAEWAYMAWKSKGSAEEARSIFSKHAGSYRTIRHFWLRWLEFEMAQPAATADVGASPGNHLHRAFDDMVNKSQLSSPVKRDLGFKYLEYLQRRSEKDAMKTYLQVDRQLLGPSSVSLLDKVKDGAGEVDDAARVRGERRFFSFYEYGGEKESGSQGPAQFH